MKIVKPILITLLFLSSSVAFAQEGDTSSQAGSSSQEGDSSSESSSSSQSSFSIPPIIWPTQSSSSSSSSHPTVNLPIGGSQDQGGCGGKEDCFPKASDYFGVTSGKVAEVIEKTKQGPNSGAQSALEEMYGNAVRGSGWDESGWAKKIKESEKTGKPEHDWKDGRGMVNTVFDHRLDSKAIVGAYMKMIDSKLAPGDVLEGDYSQAKAIFPGFGQGFKTFHRCFEPRLLSFRCPYCWPMFIRPKKIGSSCPLKSNLGFTWEYWWPEYTIEVNNFGISAVNPNYWNRNDLTHDSLLEKKNQEMEKLRKKLTDYLENDLAERLGRSPGDADYDKINDVIDDDDVGGETAFDGVTAPDQTQYMESHLYKPKVQTDTQTCGQHPWCPQDERLEMGCWGRRYLKIWRFCLPIRFWYNGYKYRDYECMQGEPNKECFYEATPEKITSRRKWTTWTEETKQAPYWRIPELSKDLNEDWYNASVPSEAKFGKGSMYNLSEQKSYLERDTCASYRASKWPEIFGEIAKEGVFDISPRQAPYMDEICYKGGGQLYPVVGSTIGSFHSLTTAALIARRAVELLSETREEIGSGYYDPDVNRYTDADGENAIDKMQMLYPRVSQCLRMGESEDSYGDVPIVSDKYDEDDAELSEFPPDIMDPKQRGTIRFVVWNRRTACSCQFKSIYKNTRRESCGIFYQKKCGWGCQIYDDMSRGNGDERPKDQYHSSNDASAASNIIGARIGEMYAEPAWQLYPFKQW